MISYNNIFFGSECNNTCVFCEARDEARTQSLKELVAQVDGMDSIENLVLSGGEPTLHRDLIALISHARRRGAKRIKLITNGRRLADMDFLTDVVEAGCRLFEVKIEGSGPEVHETVTGAANSFEQTLRGLDNLGKLAESESYDGGLFVAARVGVNSKNLDDLVPIISMATSFGMDRIVLARRGADFPMGEGSFLVANALKLATLNRIWSACEGFPPCLMTGCERHVSECLQPICRGGKKPGGCRQCDFADICAGPPPDYIQKRGAKEFRAVSGSTYIADILRLRAMRRADG